MAALSCLLQGVCVPAALSLCGGRLGDWLQREVGLRMEGGWLAPSVRCGRVGCGGVWGVEVWVWGVWGCGVVGRGGVRRVGRVGCGGLLR